MIVKKFPSSKENQLFKYYALIELYNSIDNLTFIHDRFIKGNSDKSLWPAKPLSNC